MIQFVSWEEKQSKAGKPYMAATGIENGMTRQYLIFDDQAKALVRNSQPTEQYAQVFGAPTKDGDAFFVNFVKGQDAQATPAATAAPPASAPSASSTPAGNASAAAFTNNPNQRVIPSSANNTSFAASYAKDIVCAYIGSGEFDSDKLQDHFLDFFAVIQYAIETGAPELVTNFERDILSDNPTKDKEQKVKDAVDQAFEGSAVVTKDDIPF